MSMTSVNSFYLLIPLHFFFQSVTDNVYFDGLLGCDFPFFIQIADVSFSSGGRFVIRHVF